jgi:hypothetical protein
MKTINSIVNYQNNVEKDYAFLKSETNKLMHVNKIFDVVIE